MNLALLQRKNSNESGKSASSHSAHTADTKTQTKEVIELQKKMKILKDAIIKERQEKDTLSKSNNDLTAEVDRLRALIMETERMNLKLRAENTEMIDKLQIQRKKTENFMQQSQPASGDSSSSHFPNMLKDIFGSKKGNDEYQKLLMEHNYLKKQMEVMLEKLNKADSSTDQVRREHKKQVESLQQKIAQGEKDLEDKVQAYIALGHQNQDLLQKFDSLNKDKNKIEEELRKIKKQLESVKQERDDLERQNYERTKTLSELNEVCQTMENELLKLTQDTERLTKELEESELKLQVFDVKKVGKMFETPAQILLRRNLIGDYVIEIENAGERVAISPQLVQSFGPNKETEDKFYLEYKMSNGHVQRDTFSSEDRKKILKNLMTLVRTGQENKGQKTNSVVDKNLFSQVVSFFGS